MFPSKSSPHAKTLNTVLSPTSSVSELTVPPSSVDAFCLSTNLHHRPDDSQFEN